MFGSGLVGPSATILVATITNTVMIATLNSSDLSNGA
jgi:hypothetical protein